MSPYQTVIAVIHVILSECQTVMAVMYNKVQMFEPFQDRNPHFFETVSLS